MQPEGKGENVEFFAGTTRIDGRWAGAGRWDTLGLGHALLGIKKGRCPHDLRSRDSVSAVVFRLPGTSRVSGGPKGISQQLSGASRYDGVLCMRSSSFRPVRRRIRSPWVQNTNSGSAHSSFSSRRRGNPQARTGQRRCAPKWQGSWVSRTPSMNLGYGRARHWTSGALSAVQSGQNVNPPGAQRGDERVLRDILVEVQPDSAHPGGCGSDLRSTISANASSSARSASISPALA